jgi:hypothetical protein
MEDSKEKVKIVHPKRLKIDDKVKSIKSENDTYHFSVTKKGIDTFFTFVIATIFLVMSLGVVKGVFQASSINNFPPKPSITSVIRSAQPVITTSPIPTVKPKPKVVPSPSPVDPSNQIIKCNISVKCGGGTKEMTKSSCDELVCCNYSQQNPPILTSRSKCETMISNNSPTYVPPATYQYSPIPQNTATTQTTNNSQTEQQVKDCLARWDRAMYDAISLCPINNGIQDSYCLNKAQETAGREKANCY